MVWCYFLLQELDLSVMGLKYIEVGAFCNLHQVSIFYLKDNKLQSLPELCSLKCCHVELSLYNNRLSNLNKHFFEGYKILEVVYLGNNKLLALPELHYLLWIEHSLIKLHASDNNIKSLAVFNVFGMFELLAYIDMGGNSFRVFNVTILRHMPKLKFKFKFKKSLLPQIHWYTQHIYIYKYTATIRVTKQMLICPSIGSEIN